jgi:hypothetical protein
MKACQDKDFPSTRSFRRFGKKAGLAKRVLEYAREQGDLDEVVAICKPLCEAASSDHVDESDAVSEQFGFVYLMKSGKHFKIGRSNCAERREFELRIQLPEKIKLVHKIKTDDPVGIEKYWHDRFKNKHKNGEWYELSSSDIKAFRRRKFM